MEKEEKKRTSGGEDERGRQAGESRPQLRPRDVLSATSKSPSMLTKAFCAHSPHGDVTSL